VTILEVLSDPKLFAPFFRPSESWRGWQAFLAALFGLPLDPEGLSLYRKHTGRATPPRQPAREAWVVVGRRGGKSRMAAMVAVYLACFRDYSAALAPGERGTLMVLAADRRQARTVFRYIAGLLEGVPMLERLIEGQTSDAIHLANRISIEVHTASFRAVRGYTLVAAICDEVAFWRDESSANPDAEILAALRPGMATVRGAVLLGISSPYARRGVLWEAYRRHFGQDGDPVLVWQADTLSMNPAMDPGVIERAYAEDPESARAEYGAEFRSDLECFVAREAIEAVVVPDRRELPPLDSVSYFAFTDPSGGSSESMTLAVAHWEEEHVVLDALREIRAPFSPETAVAEFAGLLRRYRIREIEGDRYAAAWVAERFEKAGLRYRPAQKSKSDLYLELLPVVNSGTVELLDHQRLVEELCALERRTSRGGRDSIDHPPKGRDDLANAVAGVVALVERKAVTPSSFSMELSVLRRTSPWAEGSYVPGRW
jgi:hypothetical protein